MASSLSAVNGSRNVGSFITIYPRPPRVLRRRTHPFFPSVASTSLNSVAHSLHLRMPCFFVTLSARAAISDFDVVMEVPLWQMRCLGLQTGAQADECCHSCRSVMARPFRAKDSNDFRRTTVVLDALHSFAGHLDETGWLLESPQENEWRSGLVRCAR